jgi:hypothetical protein
MTITERKNLVREGDLLHPPLNGRSPNFEVSQKLRLLRIRAGYFDENGNPMSRRMKYLSGQLGDNIPCKKFP